MGVVVFLRLAVGVSEQADANTEQPLKCHFAALNFQIRLFARQPRKNRVIDRMGTNLHSSPMHFLDVVRCHHQIIGRPDLRLRCNGPGRGNPIFNTAVLDLRNQRRDCSLLFSNGAHPMRTQTERIKL